MSVSMRRRISRRGRQVERRNGHAPYLAYFGLVLAGIFGVGALGAVAVASTIYSDYADDYRDPEEFIEELNPGGAKIFTSDGTLLYQYKDPDAGLRNPVPLSTIPESLKEATISTEDNSFYDNPGVNIEGLIRAAWDNTGFGSADFLEGSGGSSITQQLVKNLYFSERIPITEIDPVSGEEVVTGYRLAFEDRSYERKLKEIVLALELNDKKSKDEILELYLNTIGYGNDAYGVPLVGVQAAAEGYFDKDVTDLSLGEAALLAGLPQDPTTLNPIKHPDDARARQEDVLDLLVENGYITQAEADAAFNESYPLLEGNSGNIVQRVAEVQLRPELDNSFHFVRSYLPDVIERMCKSGELTLPEDVWDGNPDTLIETCDTEIVLRQLDEDRNGNGVLDAPEDLDGDGQIDPVEDTNGNGVLDAGEDANENGVLDTEDANQNGVLDPAEDLNDDGELQQGGTYILGGLNITISLDTTLQSAAEEMVARWSAEFDAAYGANNAALIAIEPSTGRILSYVGSRDFTLPEDSVGTQNTVIDPQTDVLQSHQSPGSAFKFFTYVTAFDRGSAEYPNWSPGSSVYNAPLKIFQPGTECTDNEPDTYCPKNAGGGTGSGGQVTVREALRESMNIPAVYTSFMICPGQGGGLTNCPIVENAHRLGITDLVNGVVNGATGEVEVVQDIGCVYDLTLGGCEVRPFDMAYAASVFANNGVMAGRPTTFNWSRLDTVRPSDGTLYSTPAEWRRPLDPVGVLKIEDADNNVLFEFTEPERQQVISPQYPYMVSDVLRLPTGTLGYEIPGQEGAVYGKTGTAEERGDLAPGVDRGNTDTWVVGYSTQVAVAVWVGNTRNEPFGRGDSSFGANTAGLIFEEFMTLFHQGRENVPIGQPEGIEEGPVGGGCDLSVRDLFVTGSQPLASARTVVDEETGEETNEPEETEYCEVVEIDTRNDLLATDCVPEEFIERRTFRNFPEGITVAGVSDAEIPQETSDLCEEDGTIPPFILADPTGDFDQDDVINIFDNCPLVPNRNQRDEDGDDVGDACDSEDGGDNPFPDDDDGVIIDDDDDDDDDDGNNGGNNPFPNQ